MAVINITSSLLSFSINGTSSNLLNCVGTYGTLDILNGGETIDNTLIYIFNIKGLNGHTINSVTTKSLLLTDLGELNNSQTLYLAVSDIGSPVTKVLEGNNSNKTLIATKFNGTLDITEDSYNLVYTVMGTTSNSCYYGLQSILIDLSDINYSIQLSFSGPKTSRTANSIIVAPLVLNKNAVNVTFSKDQTSDYNSSLDNVEGRLYLKQNGIFVDGYLYGVNATATETVKGTVKLQNTFEKTSEGVIIAPSDSGVAATPLMVYNTIATLKQYTDDKIDGIPAPSIELDDDTINEIESDYTFSKDFVQTDGKIYINWLELI